MRRTLLAIALAVALPAIAGPTLTFDAGGMTTVDGVAGWLEDGVFITGNFAIGDINGDGSNDITVTPQGGDVSFRIVDPQGAAGWHFAMDLVANPNAWGMVQYDNIGIDVLFGITTGVLHVSDPAQGWGSLNFHGDTLAWRQGKVWSAPPDWHWNIGGVLSADNISFTAGLQDVPLPVPEPSTYALMAAGLGLLAFRRRAAQRLNSTR